MKKILTGKKPFSLLSLSLYQWCMLYKIGAMHSNPILQGEAVPINPSCYGSRTLSTKPVDLAFT